ncbi:MAG: NTP transferase domain-containing protein [Treponema sp.]|nr:NTP transferase domain-containing protein [Treponema sp.]
MLAVILQARIDSRRLSEKSLLPLGGKPLVFRVMEALRRIPADIYILACPETSYQSFSGIAAEAGFELFTGDENDVLSRYSSAVSRFGISRFIRATGDNPFVFADAAAAICAEAIELNADYAGYSGLPYGAGVEVVSAEALRRAEVEAVAVYEREHVCPYLYNNPGLFRLHRPLAPKKWQDENNSIRITVDTQEDFEMAQKLHAGLENNKDRYNGQSIINCFLEIFQK